jgi:hypothetical protein
MPAFVTWLFSRCRSGAAGANKVGFPRD